MEACSEALGEERRCRVLGEAELVVVDARQDADGRGDDGGGRKDVREAPGRKAMSRGKPQREEKKAYKHTVRTIA